MKPDRNPSGFLVEVGGKRILLDCGTGTIRQMVRRGIDIQSIDLLFTSHFHTDHFGDAEALVHMRYIDDRAEGRDHQKLLWLGPPNTQKNFNKLRSIFWAENGEVYPIEIKEGTLQMQFGDIKIKTFPICHTECYRSEGIKITFGGKTLAYPGDLGSRQDLAKLEKTISDADLLLIEAGLEKPTPNHFTLEQTKLINRSRKNKKTLLVHLRPSEDKRIKSFCAKHKDFVAARDGLELEV